MFIAAEGV